jgi:serine/threonine-protein kinase
MILAGLLVVAGGSWYLSQHMGGADAPRTAQAPAAPPGTPPAASAAAASPASAAAPASPPGAVAAAPAATRRDPGTVLISAVGVADPANPRYQQDKSALQGDARADSKSQVIEKALGLLVDRKSLAANYNVVQDKLLSQSGSYIANVVNESEPVVGKDGLMTVTTQAVVNVKALQKSLNQMSRDERLTLIRAQGDPRIALRVAVRDADQPDAPPQPSPVAENIVKDRIRSFGFRTWSGNSAGDAPDFLVDGEAKIKRLTMRLEASGLVVTKYALTSWTVKCTDRATGEEVYYNTALPKNVGTWASEEDALKAIGTRVADEFSRDFFLSHVTSAGQTVALVLSGVPEGPAEQLIVRELVGLPAVIAVRPHEPPAAHTYDVQLASNGVAGDVVNAEVLPPLNAKLGQSCFALGATAGDRVTVKFDAACADASVLGRLETNPPAGLYNAPPARQKAVVTNPDTRRKLLL